MTEPARGATPGTPAEPARGATPGTPAEPDRGATPGTPAEPGRSFGEEGGLLTYGRYLRLPQLLTQQVPQSDPPVHDELLFIVVHQTYELWFKQLLQELTAVRDTMLAAAKPVPGEDARTVQPARPPGSQLWRVRQLWRRVHVIERLLVSQIDVLETMAPQDFSEFRSVLAPASGFQSVQFRELEFLSGAKDPGFIRRFRSLTDSEQARLARRLAEPTLWDGYVALLASRGLPVGSDKEILTALAGVARDRPHHDDLWELAEDLLTHDELAALWRARHVQMVERQIGTRSGTGGSTGAPYLQSRVPLRYYPLLWELRDSL